MDRSDSPYVIDWYVISLRWIVLLGATAALALTGAGNSPVNLLVVVLATWNIILTWLAGQSWRLKYHREISVGIDLLAAALFYWLDRGGLTGPAAWIVLLPLFSAGLYFNLIGGVLAAGFMVLVETMDFFLSGNNIWYYILGAAATLLLGGLFGLISQQAYKQIQEERKNVHERKHKGDADRLRAIYNMSSALTSTLSYKRVLESALDLSVNVLNVEGVEPDQAANDEDPRLTSAILMFQGQVLAVHSSHRLTQADLRATFPAKEGVLAKIIEDGEPLVTGNLTEDPELGQLVGLLKCNSIYCIPMRSGLNVYGAMIFGHPTPGYFNSERCDILGIVGRQTVIAIQNARLYQDLADEKERIVEVQEVTRKKMARDLHDGPTQSITALGMHVNLARRLIEQDPKAAAEELEKIESLVAQTTKEIRHMLFTLRPLVLESQGLTAALQTTANKMKGTFGQEVIIQVDENFANQIEMSKSIVIFYFVEEAVSNARKHARATQIRVRLNPLPKHPEIAALEIADNGIGFDTEDINRPFYNNDSFGLVNLRERAGLVNGALNIKSAPGEGTKIQLFIPLSEEAADLLNNARDNQQDQAHDNV